MKKWLALLQTASQLEFSFQGLCRQVMHEQVCPSSHVFTLPVFRFPNDGGGQVTK